MATTNNGYTLAPPASTLETFSVNGLSFQTLKGDLATVFQYIAEEFHEHVETLTHRSSYRSPSANRGDSDSNHMSATAIDLNGYWLSGTPRHPYEILLPASKRYANYDDGFNAQKRATIRRILADVNGTTNVRAGVIQWGLDYNVPYRDAMHFQVRPGMDRADIAAAAQRVRKIRAARVKTHRRWVKAKTHAYKAPGKGRGRLLAEGLSFLVVTGSGRQVGKEWWVETSAGNWVRAAKTTKSRPKHRRAATAELNVRKTPGGEPARKPLAKGQSFTVWNGSAKKVNGLWWVQTTSGNWVADKYTKKV